MKGRNHMLLSNLIYGGDIEMTYLKFGLSVGQDKFHEFTEFLHSLHPTIKFTLVYSANELNVLDLTLSFNQGLIITDVYSKPKDNHIYLDPCSYVDRIHHIAQKLSPMGLLQELEGIVQRLALLTKEALNTKA